MAIPKKVQTRIKASLRKIPFFNFKGRYSRQPYILWTLAISLALVVSLAVTTGIYRHRALRASTYARIQVEYEEATNMLSLISAILLLFPSVKRLHDLGKPGWHYALFLIPFYNIYLGLLLLFRRGTRGKNEYGDDPLLAPRKNTVYNQRR